MWSKTVNVYVNLCLFLLPESPIEDSDVIKLTEIILASKEATGKIRMLLDILHSDSVTSPDCRNILSAVAGQLSECSVATRYEKSLDTSLSLASFFGFDCCRIQCTIPISLYA